MSQRFQVRITTDETMVVEATDEDEAVEKAWGEIMDTGAWGLEIEEVEDESDV